MSDQTRRGPAPEAQDRSKGFLVGTLGLLTAVFFWGAHIPFLHDLTQRHDPYVVATFRYVFAAPFLWVLVWLFERSGRTAPLPRPTWGQYFIIGASMTGFAVFFTFGAALANPITVSILAASSPIIAAFVAWATAGERPSRGVLIGLALVLPGGLLVGVDWTAAGARLVLTGGEVFVVLGIASWSWYSLKAQQWLSGCSALRITAISATAASPVGLPIYAAAVAMGLTYGDPFSASGTDILFFTAIFLGAAALGVVGWHMGILKFGLVIAALHLNLIPLVGVAVAMALGIQPRLEQILGGALVLVGVIVAQRLNYRDRF